MEDRGRLSRIIDTKSWDASSAGLITHSRIWLEVKDVMNKDVITVCSDETIESAANIMSENNISSLIVVDDGIVSGIVTEKDFLSRIGSNIKISVKTKVAEIMSCPVELVSPDLSVLDASKIMESKHIKRLPVITDNLLIGVVTQTDLNKALTSYGMWRNVDEVMSSDTAVIQTESTVAQAAEIMKSRNISCIVAMKAGNAAGVFSERDLLQRVFSANKNPWETKVEDVMSSPVVSIPSDYSIFSANKLMEKLHVRRLVVMDDNRLVGTMTQTDIFRAIKAKLEEEEDRTRDLLEGSENCIYTLDLDGKITYVNPAFMRLLEVSKREVLINQTFLPDCFWFDQKDKRHLLDELKDEHIEIQELTLKTAKQRRIYVTLYSTFAKNIHGEIRGSQGILFDITARKEAEESAAIAYKKLEKSNRELRETQSQLVQNEKLASIGQLAAGVAHEINTPVGFVTSNFQTLESYIKKIHELLDMYEEFTGMIEKLGEKKLSNKIDLINQFYDDKKIGFILEDIQGLFDESREGLERITNVVKNLRDFSRIDQPGSRDKFDINYGIKTTLIVAKNEIKYNADVKTEFSKLPLILCNSGQINQVFLNILINAAQAIKSQKRDMRGTITIRTYVTDDEVVCEITDDGPGIPLDKLSKIFDPFFTTKPVGKGTGLGLSVSYDIIVNKHNGKLLVESVVGEGAKFIIKLPIVTKENLVTDTYALETT
jgi:PAS domain S-box-containing protein